MGKPLFALHIDYAPVCDTSLLGPLPVGASVAIATDAG